MKKRIISLLLCLCILAACIPAVSAYSNLGTWAKESVEAMYDLGFLPDSLVKADMSKPITRGQMCQMAVLVYNQLMGTPGVGPDSTKNFDDTSDPDINYAFEQGIVGGYGDGNFGPNDPLTRQDFFKITYNMMATAYWDPNTITLASLNKFYDAGSISAYAVTPTKATVPISEDIQNPGLFEVLREWRNDRAKRENIPPYVVASTKALIAVANAVPTTLAQLRALPGWGPKSVARFGDDLLDVIAAADY